MGKEEFFIRRLKKEYEENFFEFFKALSEKTKNFFNPHLFDRETARKLCRENKKTIRRFVISNKKGEIFGYGFLSALDREFPTLGICIRDDVHGKGLGKMMMEYLINYAKSRNKKGILLTVFKDNKRAFNLYKKYGFKVEREIYSMKLKF